ncbi:MAG: hypothetical protein E6J41_12660 [Chloroflexi bacterium]|nr:MAG: hypothetical protein E6J41_12660 [Chloroflexota bacterium]
MSNESDAPQWPTGDLAQAIVALGRAAERRRNAATDLIKSTDVVARAIRAQLRGGDAIEVAGEDGQPPAAYRAARVGRAGGFLEEALGGEPSGEDVLLRGSAILGLQQARGRYRDLDGEGELHPATAEERDQFVREAHGVVREFGRLLDEQAGRYGEAAERATKLTPR